MNHDALFAPLQLGTIKVQNRIIMAPLTRMRAGTGNVPTALNAKYYAQRASAGLIIAEGTAVSHQGQGYPGAPGIYTEDQINGWRSVTDAVHSKRGRIFLQIAHNGRNSHSSLLPQNSLPVAPSAIPPDLPAFTNEFKQVPTETPRALETDEISTIVDTFVQAALNAIEAGFDGVEVQAANSHLIDQFLQDGTNKRTDEYGGIAENRVRFLLEVVDKVSAAVGINRLGVRLSPFGQYGGIHDSNPLHLYGIAISALDKRQIAYLHLIEGRGSEIGLGDGLHEEALNNAQLFRSNFRGPLISAAAYTPSSATQTVSKGEADGIAFGRLFIANPDLVERIRDGLPMNKYDRSTFYGGGEHGYTDYPVAI
ncbi:NADH:flavin oxidoreductase (plasmid) [Acidisarcina polymorpha]|uniref:NADH:flavin oxidoreductase n=1 Tax=Acidisarcina polymorpha TaxID=2211140 RepID=A0A2Z5GCT0_9BACT|nr:alkene reductase [Acidisarcina polymorpha]AXC16386.1 NADH:flavin oxidoreductase [Acidisarcina polymorpha]